MKPLDVDGVTVPGLMWPHSAPELPGQDEGRSHRAALFRFFSIGCLDGVQIEV
jgi:hypothetical protein